MTRQEVVEKLCNDWPKRIGLTPKELVVVLGKEPTKKRVERIRNKLKSGEFGEPMMVDGKQQLSLHDVAGLFVSEPAKPTQVTAKPTLPRRRRKAEIGPRLSHSGRGR